MGCGGIVHILYVLQKQTKTRAYALAFARATSGSLRFFRRLACGFRRVRCDVLRLGLIDRLRDRRFDLDKAVIDVPRDIGERQSVTVAFAEELQEFADGNARALLAVKLVELVADRELG